MSRAALTALVWAAVAALAAAPAAKAVDPHLDPGLVSGGCTACHRGHGAPRSPMLPAPVQAVCLGCHGSRADLAARVLAGDVAPGADPPLLGAVLALPYGHPISATAFSAREADAVVCTSCHSSHRGSPDSGPAAATGRRLPSPKDPGRFEYELCVECHGEGPTGPSRATDVGRLLAPRNRSYHPVEAPAVERSPSVAPALAGGEINCTDCHGNDDSGGPRGPHGSRTAYLLRAGYTTADGGAESAATYALCYRCHDRTAVLEQSNFPLHREHVVDQRASCATCHDPHGSVDRRALIRFGDPSRLGREVLPNGRGQLAFVSSGPGSGACYLSCHGEDHDPETYGAAALVPEPGPALLAPGPLLPSEPPEAIDGPPVRRRPLVPRPRDPR